MISTTRASMERRFGFDFSGVRIHTDHQAGESAKAVKAMAYTVGSDVVFDSGLYDPRSVSGARLLAHELAHVIQQDQGHSQLLQRRGWGESESDEPDPSAEEAAQEMAVPVAEEMKGSATSLLTRSQVESYIAANNNAPVSGQLLLCMIWKESGFDPTVKSSGSSATGLMQMTKPAVTTVNQNTPKGVHFEHSEMTDPARNIACGSHYLRIRIDWANGDLKKGLEGFGTGTGYADDILACETCIKGKPANPDACLTAIHK